MCGSVWACLALILGGLNGCDRAAPTASNPTPDLGPRQTLSALLAARKSGSYRTLEPLTVRAHRSEVVEILIAVDGFLEANRSLVRTVRELLNAGQAETIDQSYLADNLDVFSPDVRILGDTVTGARAEVSFQVGEQLPIRRALFLREDGGWRYDPGPGYDPALPRAFSDMAHGLQTVEQDLKAGRLDLGKLKSNPQMLPDEVRTRLSSGVRRLPAPPTSAASRPVP